MALNTQYITASELRYLYDGWYYPPTYRTSYNATTGLYTEKE